MLLTASLNISESLSSYTWVEFHQYSHRHVLNTNYEMATSLPAVENSARTYTAVPQSIALLLGHLLL